jgi:hypothetical protein
MRRPNKRAILGLLVILVLLAAAFIAINRKTLFPNLFPEKKKPIPEVFGKPNYSKEVKFVLGDQNYKSSILGIKSSSKSVEEITIYDTNNVGIFQKKFYEDAFLGSILTYSIASDTGEITQTGSLGSLGCNNNQCNIMWTNFYTLDKEKNSYELDNASHKDFYKSLLVSYSVLDNRGCNILGNQIILSHDKLTFTELYAKYPTIPYYCSKELGILPENLQLFLKAKKAVQEVIDGKNISSEEIQEVSL